MADPQQTEALIAQFRTDHDRVKNEVRKAVVGHEEIIDGVVVCASSRAATRCSRAFPAWARPC